MLDNYQKTDMNSGQDLPPETPHDTEAFRKQFRFGHMEEQLKNAGEPIATINAIVDGKYTPDMEVRDCEQPYDTKE